MKAFNIRSEQFQNIHYRKSGAGPVVVLIHGFPASGDLWEPIVPVLAGSFTVIVPDLPGSGASLPDPKDTSMELLAGSIATILDHENTREVVIAGHSMGGYVAMAFAEAYGARLRGLSMVHSTAAADTDEKKETRRRSIELIRKGGREPFIKGMIPNLFSERFKELHPEIIREQTARGLELRDDSMIAFYNAMMNRPDRTHILKDANFPVQWIAGREDSVVPQDAVLSQSRLARINFVSLYSNCGHMSMLEHPEGLAKDLKDFITYCYNR